MLPFSDSNLSTLKTKKMLKLVPVFNSNIKVVFLCIGWTLDWCERGQVSHLLQHYSWILELHTPRFTARLSLQVWWAWRTVCWWPNWLAHTHAHIHPHPPTHPHPRTHTHTHAHTHTHTHTHTHAHTHTHTQWHVFEHVLCTSIVPGKLCGECLDGYGPSFDLRFCSNECVPGGVLLFIFICIITMIGSLLVLYFDFPIPNELKGVIFFTQVRARIHVTISKKRLVLNYHNDWTLKPRLHEDSIRIKGLV